MNALPPPFSLNRRVLAVDAPPIPEAQAWKELYSGDAGPMIDLSQAVPSTPPPASMLEALGRAAEQGDTSRYGPILGDIETDISRNLKGLGAIEIANAVVSPGSRPLFGFSINSTVNARSQLSTPIGIDS